MLVKDLPEVKSGYVEALHAKFEEDVCGKELPIVDHHYETYLFALSQLPGPDNSVGPGFKDTAEWLLGDRITPKAMSLIHESGWSLHRLLTATNDDLREIGIVFHIDRANILAAVRAFHLTPWRTMQTINLKPDGSNKKYKEHIIFLLETFSRLTQQLYIDNAAISWLRQRLPSDQSERERLMVLVKEALATSENLMKVTERIHNHIKESNKNLPHHPVDYIGPVDKKSRPLYKRIILSSAFLVSVFLLSPIIENKIQHSVFSPLSKLPLKWCILFGWICA